MKKIILLSSFIAIFLGVQAQQINVKEISGTFGKETHNALSTSVFYTDAKTVEKEFNNFVKSYKGKASKKKGVIFGDDLFISTISSNTFDIYATVTKVKGSDEVQLVVAFDLGGAYLSSRMHPEQYDRAVQLLKDFSLGITEKSYAGMVKNQEKNVGKQQKAYDKLVQSKDKLESENEKLKKQITSNEKKIEDYKKQIKTKESELNDIKKSFDDMKKESSNIK